MCLTLVSIREHNDLIVRQYHTTERKDIVLLFRYAQFLNGKVFYSGASRNLLEIHIRRNNMNQENEIRFYLTQILTLMEEPTEEEKAEGAKAFVPQHIVTATRLPSGAIEIAINTVDIAKKIEYILEAYDEEMYLKTNTAIRIENLMVV